MTQDGGEFGFAVGDVVVGVTGVAGVLLLSQGVDHFAKSHQRLVDAYSLLLHVLVLIRGVLVEVA